MHGCSARGHAWPRGVGDGGGGSGAAQQVFGEIELGESGEAHANLAWLVLQAGGRRGPTEPGGDTCGNRLSQRPGPQRTSEPLGFYQDN